MRQVTTHLSLAAALLTAAIGVIVLNGDMSADGGATMAAVGPHSCVIEITPVLPPGESSRQSRPMPRGLPYAPAIIPPAAGAVPPPSIAVPGPVPPPLPPVGSLPPGGIGAPQAAVGDPWPGSCAAPPPYALSLLGQAPGTARDPGYP